ncbi:MAG: response regulator, partial [Spirochaetales bacterium]|nr:response regulator [Spirochaetales bacterium]
MLKLLIVDDEKKVCQLIEYILDWKNLGISIIGTANDGETAYKKILEEEPDIVITDIRIPIYDGIEIIKKTREQGLDVSFIIISGYSQFEYAQSAIQFGVVNYLLKPIKKKELQISIEKIIKKKETKNAFEKENKVLKKHLAINEQNNRANFLKDLLTISPEKEDNYFQRKEIEDINKKYSCNFQQGYFFL